MNGGQSAFGIGPEAGATPTPIVVLLIAAVQTAEGSQQDSRTARHYPTRREPEIGEAEAGGASIYYEAMLALMERMLNAPGSIGYKRAG